MLSVSRCRFNFCLFQAFNNAVTPFGCFTAHPWFIGDRDEQGERRTSMVIVGWSMYHTSCSLSVGFRIR